MWGTALTVVGDCPPGGSCPLAWGTDQCRTRYSRECRVSSVCVGNSSRPPPGLSGPSDHPRMRGEQSVCMTDHKHVVQTSPYAWGTGRVRLRVVWVADRARMRGEQTVGYGPICADHQDHPRMRGEPFGVTAVKGDQVRIIPVCVGNTTFPPGIVWRPGSYPCAWGTGIGGGRNGRRFGSHRTCGKQGFGGAPYKPGQRIIPVRVGNRLRSRIHRARRRVNGSSPRGER